MKISFYKPFISVVLSWFLILFAACTNEGELDRAGTINFLTSDNTLRASETDAENILDFRVWSMWTRTASSMIYMDGLKVARADNQTPWTYSPAYYWPAEGRLDFYAYSPAASTGVLNFDMESRTLTYDVTTDHQRQEDFVMASALNPAFNSQVSFEFEHLLSQASFVVKNEITAAVTLKKIELKNLYRQGTLTGASGAWTWSDQQTPVTYSAYLPAEINIAPSGTLTISNAGGTGNLMILPQTPDASSEIVVTYDVSGVSVTHSFPYPGAPAFEFEQGKKYMFYLVLTRLT